MEKVAIICDGKEISYGLGLLHLLQFKNDCEMFTSERGKSLSAEIYTIGTFKNSEISKNIVCVFVNNGSALSSGKKIVFNEDGVQILKDENKYVIYANPEHLENADYTGFILRASKLRNEYYQLEKEYVNRISTMGVDWLPDRFSLLPSTGIFFKNKFLKNILQQQYDYAAYVLYFML